MELHTGRVLHFVNSPGFGFGRMGGPAVALAAHS